MSKRLAILLLLAAPAFAQDQVIVPTGTAESSSNSCITNAHLTCDEGVPGGGDWCSSLTCGVNPTNDTAWRFTLPTPTSNPSTASNAQVFAATVRSCASGGSDPTCRLSLYCNGSLIQQGSDQTITSSTGQTITQNITFGGSCAADGSDAEIRVYCVASGGTPSGRRTGDLDSVEWRVTWAAASSRRIISIGGAE